MTNSRRRFLQSMLMASVALPAGWLPAPAPAAPPVAIRRIGNSFLVNGWVLTEADVRSLGLHAV